MAENIDVRLLALETLLEIEKKNGYAKDALSKELYRNQFLGKQERAFLSRLVEGVTEYKLRLDYIINQFSKTKVQKCKPLIRCVLRIGVYQILFMDSVPKEVACDECVKLTKKKGFRNLSGFVNGVLRNLCRNIDQITYPLEEKEPKLYLSVMYSFPIWLVEQLLEWYEYPVVKGILEASVTAPDLTIRVNEARIRKEELKAKIEEKGICVRDGAYVKEALHLSNINYVNRIPGFKDGLFFVQDESSMLLCSVSGIRENLSNQSEWKVLDLCAAPGGKCTHFAQVLQDKGSIFARDLSEKKVAMIDENIARLQLDNIETMIWDACVFDASLEGKMDVVIADLPCSGLGILAKKNDIKYHITKEQLMELKVLQQEILKNAVRYLKSGGVLLFSTCTINPEENMENVKWLLTQKGLKKATIKDVTPKELQSSLVDENMLQLLPGKVSCDGFFISKFVKE